MKDKVISTPAWRILLGGRGKSRAHAALSIDSVFSSNETCRCADIQGQPAWVLVEPGSMCHPEAHLKHCSTRVFPRKGAARPDLMHNRPIFWFGLDCAPALRYYHFRFGADERNAGQTKIDLRLLRMRTTVARERAAARGRGSSSILDHGVEPVHAHLPILDYLSA